ncbi:phosphate ABC transporter permease PstA [Massiliimalia massiliensis]|uniref:phosphate ABC transporter permease PstA n=1 Tax=Massiliimalia massiliensis TaxID=1852384 RepID=UPI000985771B|nr:phosphate ABC transporter permease PstA [Massiliimalia massiliensis]
MTNSVSIYDKKKRPGDMALLIVIYICAFLAVLLLVGIIGYVVYRGISVVDWQFISTAQSALNETFGILPNIINTLYIIVITLLIATPVGIGSAIYLTEYSKGGRLVRLIEFTTETLSGIPSIIFGLFGMVFFGTVLRLGFSILCGALTLTIMILPIITRTTQEALKTVPESYRTGALGIGATKWYMIRTIILPSAMPGIVTGVILSIGRIVGESAALLFTAGSAFLMPNNWLTHPMTSGGTLTIQMYLSMTKAQYDNAFGIALVLIIIVLGINLLTKLLSRKLDVSRKS